MGINSTNTSLHKISLWKVYSTLNSRSSSLENPNTWRFPGDTYALIILVNVDSICDHNHFSVLCCAHTNLRMEDAVDYPMWSKAGFLGCTHPLTSEFKAGNHNSQLLNLSCNTTCTDSRIKGWISSTLDPNCWCRTDFAPNHHEGWCM